MPDPYNTAGKCQRKEPPCKYLHPPQHLREQLLQNGRNNLILKNLQIQAAQQAALNQGMVPGLIPISHSSNIAYSSPMAILPRPRPEAGTNKTAMGYPTSIVHPGQYPPILDSFGQFYSQLSYKTAHPYLGGAAPTPTSVAFPPYMNSMPTIAVGGAQTNGESPSLVSHQPGVIPTALQNSTAATKLTRPDRLESQVPGMVGQYKRVAMADAKGLPMYQPISNIGPYQQAIAMQLQQPQYIPVSLPMVVSPEMVSPQLVPGVSPLPGSMVPSNAHSVNYLDENRQLLDTLPVCKDFKMGLCQRPDCKYIHIVEDYVEVSDGRVTVCRDAVRGKCSRPTCKYYHIPVPLPPAE